MWNYNGADWERRLIEDMEAAGPTEVKHRLKTGYYEIKGQHRNVQAWLDRKEAETSDARHKEAAGREVDRNTLAKRAVTISWLALGISTLSFLLVGYNTLFPRTVVTVERPLHAPVEKKN